MEVLRDSQKRADVPAKNAEVCGRFRGCRAQQALAVLAVVPRKGARFVAKTAQVGHCQRRKQQESQAGTLAREGSRDRFGDDHQTVHAQARGSAGPILKRRCHIKITVSDE